MTAPDQCCSNVRKFLPYAVHIATEPKGLAQRKRIARSIGEFFSFIGEFFSIVSPFKMRITSTHQSTATSSERREVTRQQRVPNRHPSNAIAIVFLFLAIASVLVFWFVTPDFGFSGAEQWLP